MTVVVQNNNNTGAHTHAHTNHFAERMGELREQSCWKAATKYVHRETSQQRSLARMLQRLSTETNTYGKATTAFSTLQMKHTLFDFRTAFECSVNRFVFAMNRLQRMKKL